MNNQLYLVKDFQSISHFFANRTLQIKFVTVKYLVVKKKHQQLNQSLLKNVLNFRLVVSFKFTFC